jgi:hypothetical protein
MSRPNRTEEIHSAICLLEPGGFRAARLIRFCKVPESIFQDACKGRAGFGQGECLMKKRA